MFRINRYFDDQVVSIAFAGEELPATVGVMAPGEYQFSTSQHETVTVISGLLTVQLPGESGWRDYRAGDRFEVPAGQKFDLRVARDTAYLCTYG